MRALMSRYLGLFHGSIARQIIGPIAAAVVALMTVCAVSEWIVVERATRAKLREEVAETGATLDAALRHAMSVNDGEAITNMIARVGAMDMIRRVSLMDGEGKVTQSSDKTVIGGGADKLLPAKMAPAVAPVRLARAEGGRHFMQVVSPIPADDSCLGCHSDLKLGDTTGYLVIERWADRDLKAARMSQLRRVFSSLLLIGLMTGVLVWVARAITRPLTAITSAAARIARGDISQQVEHRSDDEIGTLADSFRDLTAYLQEMAGGAKALSQGDLSVRVAPRSEQDALANNFAEARAAIEGLIAETSALTVAASEGRLDTRADETRHQGDFRRIVAGFNATLDEVLTPIKEAAAVLETLSNCDLRARVGGEYKGDHAKIKESLNQTAQALHDAMSQVADAVEQVTSASGQIASSSQQVAEGASEQASSLEETSSSLEEMSSMTKQNADNTQQAKALVDVTAAAAKKGTTSMDQMMEAMGKIRASSAGTVQIIRDINEIAFQTNLLALNAAVEAARAGEAGRGFAVVAEEVRTLAQRSKEAAKKTEDLIHESVTLAEGGVKLSREMGANLDEILMSVNKVTEIVDEVSSASREQSRGIDQVNTAVSETDRAVQTAAANAEESSSAAQELAGQAQELAAMVGRFQLSRPATGGVGTRGGARAAATRRPAAPPIRQQDGWERDPGPAASLEDDPALATF